MKKIVFGIIVMFAGLFLLLNNMNLFYGWFGYDAYRYIWSWQTLLMAIGLVLLFDKKRQNKNAGVILIAVGALFFLKNFLYIDIGQIIFPALIIAFGMFLIIKATTKKKFFTTDKSKMVFGSLHNENFAEEPFTETPLENSEYIEREYIFTGSKEKWTFGNVKKISIKTVFGGAEIDLTQIEFSEDTDKITIDVEAVFGGVVLYVPETWNIILSRDGVFGGISDNRPKNILKASNGKTVYLNIEAVFGGGELRCYE